MEIFNSSHLKFYHAWKERESSTFNTLRSSLLAMQTQYLMYIPNTGISSTAFMCRGTAGNLSSPSALVPARRSRADQ